MGFPSLPRAWVTRLCVTFCIQATCPAWAHSQSYKCSCAKTTGIIFCFVYEHSFALSFSFIFCAMSEIKTVSASMRRLGRQHSSGNSRHWRVYTQARSVFTYFQPFLWNRDHAGCFKTLHTALLSYPHLPWLLAIKNPLSTRYLLCRIIIYQALHLLLMKHNLTTSLTNT